MNTALKVGAVSALTLVGMAAHASISQPSTGSSDAILFAEVVNAAGTAAVASYAGDTGISINTLEAGGYNATGVLGSDANLSKLFAADTAAGETIEFAVLGGQYTGNTTAPNFKVPGVAQFLTTTLNNSTQSLANDTPQSLVHFGNGLNSDISAINSNSGGANSVEGANPATAGVWDITQTLGTAYWDGGATANGNLIGGTEKLFYVTAGAAGGQTTRVAYTEVEDVSLTTAGLNITAVGGGTPPPIPLPAAVWLLGSGLLGLAGVARRKSQV